MNEEQWKRLHRLVKARINHLGYTRAQLGERGAPSSEWIRQLGDGEGAPSGRRAGHFRALDKALGWPENTSWDMLTKDRSDWTEDVLADEEQQLVYGDEYLDMEPRIRHLQTAVGAALRSMPREQADETMLQILRLIGVPE